MTRPEHIVRMVLSGMVMLVMASAVTAGEPAAGKEDRGGKPAKAKTLAKVRPIMVTMSGAACGHDVTPLSVRLNKTNRDALRWLIQNNCASPQKILICAYRGSTLFDPFETCVNTSTAGLGIGRAFTVGAGTSENFECTAKVEGHYKKLVLVGNDVPSSGCATTSVKPVIRTHRLDVEIIR